MKKIFYLLFITTLVLSSCTSFIEDQNIDPNGIQPEQVRSRDMIQGVMLGTQFWQTGPASRHMMLWMNQATGSDRQYISLNNWNNATTSDFNGSWGMAYSNSMYHAKQTADKATEEGNPKLAGVAKVLQAQSLGMVASLWGDIPASEFGDYDNFPNPAYDSQSSVYEQVQIMLDEAINLMESDTSVAFLLDGSKDIHYGGNVSRWIELAHSLKARFYLHVKDYENANTQANLGIHNAAGDYKAVFNNSLGGKNPYNQFMQTDREGYLTAANAYGWALLKQGQPQYRGHSKTKEHLRVLYNYKNTNDPSNADLDFSSYNSKFAESSNMPLVTWGEMLLIKAEYEARVNGVEAGITAYNNYRAQLRSGYSIGINDDCWGNPTACNSRYLDFEMADFEPMGLENEDGVDTMHAFLRELYEERYVYFIAHFESFTDFRRTHNIAEVQLKSFDNEPQRFIYPQSEINANTSTPSPVPSVSARTEVND